MGLSGKRVPGLVQPHHFLHIIRNSKNRLQEKTGFEQEQVRTEDQRHKVLCCEQRKQNKSRTAYPIDAAC